MVRIACRSVTQNFGINRAPRASRRLFVFDDIYPCAFAKHESIAIRRNGLDPARAGRSRTPSERASDRIPPRIPGASGASAPPVTIMSARPL